MRRASEQRLQLAGREHREHLHRQRLAHASEVVRQLCIAGSQRYGLRLTSEFNTVLDGCSRHALMEGEVAPTSTQASVTTCVFTNTTHGKPRSYQAVAIHVGMHLVVQLLARLRIQLLHHESPKALQQQPRTTHPAATAAATHTHTHTSPTSPRRRTAVTNCSATAAKSAMRTGRPTKARQTTGPTLRGSSMPCRMAMPVMAPHTRSRSRCLPGVEAAEVVGRDSPAKAFGHGANTNLRHSKRQGKRMGEREGQWRQGIRLQQQSRRRTCHG